jgi:hypothetical protein
LPLPPWEAALASALYCTLPLLHWLRWQPPQEMIRLSEQNLPPLLLQSMPLLEDPSAQPPGVHQIQHLQLQLPLLGMRPLPQPAMLQRLLMRLPFAAVRSSKLC